MSEIGSAVTRPLGGEKNEANDEGEEAGGGHECGASVSRAAGHSSVAFTMDTYQHVLPSIFLLPP